jgi:hypothetical protein
LKGFWHSARRFCIGLQPHSEGREFGSMPFMRRALCE